MVVVVVVSYLSGLAYNYYSLLDHLFDHHPPDNAKPSYYPPPERFSVIHSSTPVQLSEGDAALSEA